MWWSTAWPKTRSKLSSANGKLARPRRATVADLDPEPAALAASVASIPGEMSVAVARSISPSWSRLREK